MIKKILTICMVFVLIFCSNTISTFAQESNIIVNVEGKNINFPDAKPLLAANGKILCPIRFVAEALGADVKWQGRSKSVLITKDKNQFEFNVGTNKVSINGEEVTLIEKTVLSNGRTYVPIQFFSVVFDAIVDWNDKKGLLNIQSIKTNPEDYFKSKTPSDVDSIVVRNLEKYLNAYEKATNFQGSVLVAKGGNILIDNGYGMADAIQGTKNTNQTRFAIGSVTKQFTAMCIMQLQEQGKLSVEDKLSKYYPDFIKANDISLHNLLTHTSGIPNFTDMPQYIAQITKLTAEEDIIAFLKDKPLDFEPGKDYKYCNSGYIILGKIVEKVSGMSYEEYLKKNIFDPLGMKDTGNCYINGNKGSQAWGHIGYLDVVRADDENVTRVAHGAGNMYSTVEDLYRWDRALYTEKLVSKSTMDKIFTPYADTKGMGKYGYGWIIQSSDLGKGVMHSGNTMGFTADFRRYVDKDTTIIILTNRNQFNTSSMFTNIKAILLGNSFEMPTEKKVVKVDTAKYKNFVGDYELAPGVVISISSSNGHLYAGVTGQGTYEIYPESETKFFYRIAEAEITFVKSDKGDVTELILHQFGLEQHAKNMKYAKAEIKEITIDQKVFAAYTGDYEIAPGMNVKIFTEDGKFYVQLTGQGKMEIFGKSESEFFSKIVDAQIIFVKGEKGEITGLTIKQSGIVINAKKVK